jgi:DNA polymerase III epsilon subunit-like protein
MRFLVVDTETTGIPKSKLLTEGTLPLWPHIVQFSYIIYDTDLNKIIKVSDFVIKIPANINISDEVSNIHGITNFISQNSQYKINDALIQIINNYYNFNVDLIVGHNLSFDVNMIKVELMREIGQTNDTLDKKEFCQFLDTLNDTTNVNAPKLYCTMTHSIQLCNLKLKSKFGKEFLKFPKLNELHIQLFNSSPRNLHNSLNDVLICLRCYYMLEHKVDIIEIDANIKELLSELI